MINSTSIIEIKKKNLIHNFKLLSKISKNSICAATIKGNAYGLGDIKIFEILYKAGCKHFFFATTYEAIKIRKINKKANLYVLNGFESNEIGIFKRYNLVPILNSKKEVDIFVKSKYFNKKFKLGIHIETGLNRLGIKLEDINKEFTKNINLEILMSHLSCADNLKNKYNNFQNLNFIKSFKTFKSIKYKSLCSSAGMMNSKKYHHDMVRPGISLYGSCDNIKLKNKFFIKPVVTLKGKILQIKEIDKNKYVGYSRTFKTSEKIKIAVIGIGYADGVSRYLSNKGKLFYKNESYKIIGRVSMDSITIDISKSNYKIKIGDYVDVINESNGIEKLAKSIKTISNEILTSITKRVKRVYI